MQNHLLYFEKHWKNYGKSRRSIKDSKFSYAVAINTEGVKFNVKSIVICMFVKAAWKI